MTKYARVVGGIVVEPPLAWDGIVPTDAFPPAIAAEHVPCPPQIEQGWTFDGSNWSPPVVVDAPVDLVAYAANKRWQIETGGIVISGMQIATDRQSQALITGAFSYAQATPSEVFKFKTGSGFVELNASQIVTVAMTVAGHVQACFAAEAAVLADINLGSIVTTSDVDEHPAWPV